MSDESPDTTRPRNFPADLRSVVAEALPRIADELEALKFLAQNSGLDTLREIGDLKFSFEQFRDRIIEAAEFDNAGHARTQAMLSELLSSRTADREDFEAFKASTNDAIGELRRKLNSTNGSANGANGAHQY